MDLVLAPRGQITPTALMSEMIWSEDPASAVLWGPVTKQTPVWVERHVRSVHQSMLSIFCVNLWTHLLPSCRYGSILPFGFMTSCLLMGKQTVWSVMPCVKLKTHRQNLFNIKIVLCQWQTFNLWFNAT